MEQYGFYIDLSRCIGCNSCTVSCMQWNNIPPGNIRLMRVQTWEEGSFPNVRNHILPVNCYQCENPLCLKVCKQDAIYKDCETGAVLVNQDKCIGCRSCFKACPYGAPQFENDEPDCKMIKCDMCNDRVKEGKLPICVRSCSMRALDFLRLSELKEKYGELQQVYDMPSPKRSKPAVVFKAPEDKKKIIPYDERKTIELWQLRSPYATDQKIFDDIDQALNPVLDIVGRNHLELKAKTSVEKQYYATDDD